MCDERLIIEVRPSGLEDAARAYVAVMPELDIACPTYGPDQATAIRGQLQLMLEIGYSSQIDDYLVAELGSPPTRR